MTATGKFWCATVRLSRLHCRRFTFREKTSARNGIGFGGAHAVNYVLHIVLFNFFLWLGLSRAVAPLAVLAIAVPANFIMVRFVFKHFKKQ